MGSIAKKDTSIAQNANIDSSASIDSSAHISAEAKIGSKVVIGPGVVIGPNVTVEEDSILHAYAVVVKNTHIGPGNVIHAHAVLGGDPQDSRYQEDQYTTLRIGACNIIREFVTINRGSFLGSGETYIGEQNHLLAYTHVAHDCVVGNHITMVNNATLAGHVTVEDHAMLGAFTAVHQFCRIGAYSFLSQAAEASKDVPPYLLIRGIPGYPCGLNTVGLERQGFSDAEISVLKKAYVILYRRRLSLEAAKEALRKLAIESPLVEKILSFIAASQRGIARKQVAPTRR